MYQHKSYQPYTTTDLTSKYNKNYMNSVETLKIPKTLRSDSPLHKAFALVKDNFKRLTNAERLSQPVQRGLSISEEMQLRLTA